MTSSAPPPIEIRRLSTKAPAGDALLHVAEAAVELDAVVRDHA